MFGKPAFISFILYSKAVSGISSLSSQMFCNMFQDDESAEDTKALLPISVVAFGTMSIRKA